MLDDVEHASLERAALFQGREAGRRIAEINLAITWRDDGIRIADRGALHRFCEHGIRPSGPIVSKPLIASAAIRLPAESKSKLSTLPPDGAKRKYLGR